VGDTPALQTTLVYGGEVFLFSHNTLFKEGSRPEKEEMCKKKVGAACNIGRVTPQKVLPKKTECVVPVWGFPTKQIPPKGGMGNRVGKLGTPTASPKRKPGPLYKPKGRPFGPRFGPHPLTPFKSPKKGTLRG